MSVSVVVMTFAKYGVELYRLCSTPSDLLQDVWG